MLLTSHLDGVRAVILTVPSLETGDRFLTLMEWLADSANASSFEVSMNIYPSLQAAASICSKKRLLVAENYRINTNSAGVCARDSPHFRLTGEVT
jgi:hypothetical protein